MIDLFKKENGLAVPEFTPGAEWVLEQPSVVHRLHDAKLFLELKEFLWFFKSWHFEYDGKWEHLPLRDSKDLRDALKQPPFDSSLREYIPGFYHLVDLNSNWRLVPDYYATQLSNFQGLELHLVDNVEKAYTELKQVFSYVDVPGVVFKSLDFKHRVQLQRSDFGE